MVEIISSVKALRQEETPLNKFPTSRNFYLNTFFPKEPTNSVSPKLSSGRLQETVLQFGQTGTILCLSQGFPVPLFRWVIVRNINLPLP